MMFLSFSFSLLATIFFYYYSLSTGDSCCGGNDCTQSCPWNDACNDGHNVDCKDKISSSFKCRDKTQCTNYFDCDDHDKALRAGNLCNNFPWFNGGYPFDAIENDDEYETYGCEVDTSQYCSQWFTNENSIDEFETGTATCLTESNNSEYCQSWHIEQKEYKKCFYSWVNNDDGDAQYTIVCCNNDNQNLYSCCSSQCPTSYYDAYPPQTEYADCSCTTVAENGEYCQEWFCEEYQYAAQSFSEGKEYEEYKCLSANDEDKYCTSWVGAIDSVEEFEVAACFCSALDDSGEFCRTWYCDEQGVDYWWPNMLWCLFSAILGVIPSCVFVYGMLFVLQYDHESYTNFWQYFLLTFGFSLIWGGGFTVIGIWKAGLGVFFCVYSAVILGWILVVGKYLWIASQFAEKKTVPVSSVETARMEDDDRFDDFYPKTVAVSASGPSTTRNNDVQVQQQQLSHHNKIVAVNVEVSHSPHRDEATTITKMILVYAATNPEKNNGRLFKRIGKKSTFLFKDCATVTRHSFEVPMNEYITSIQYSQSILTGVNHIQFITNTGLRSSTFGVPGAVDRQHTVQISSPPNSHEFSISSGLLSSIVDFTTLTGSTTERNTTERTCCNIRSSTFFSCSSLPWYISEIHYGLFNADAPSAPPLEAIEIDGSVAKLGNAPEMLRLGYSATEASQTEAVSSEEHLEVVVRDQVTIEKDLMDLKSLYERGILAQEYYFDRVDHLTNELNQVIRQVPCIYLAYRDN